MVGISPALYTLAMCDIIPGIKRRSSNKDQSTGRPIQRKRNVSSNKDQLTDRPIEEIKKFHLEMSNTAGPKGRYPSNNQTGENKRKKTKKREKKGKQTNKKNEH